jgi:adenosylmethionine-8-amino-7-oxononanoate aminotransferase
MNSRRLVRLDQQNLWHPFTQMRDWLKREPIVIVEGEGAVLRDARGREYLDANSSIWTNLHGHRHPKLNAALNVQLRKIAHSSALGLANEPASLLGARLVGAANPNFLTEPAKPANAHSGVTAISCHARAGRLENPELARVFYSDNGSTAVEVALKLAYEFTRRTGHRRKPRFLSLNGAYHGDTVGAVALGHIDLFHAAYAGLLFRTDKVMAPYCYRCIFNRSKPDRADAREYRRCNWECLDVVSAAFEKQKKRGNPYAAFVFEPLIQGAAGMIPQPTGWLRQAAAIARSHGALLIADEVMTGFGRTGVDLPDTQSTPASKSKPRAFWADCRLFASHKERVQPDFLALAKGLTGGYLPMAATLTTQLVFDAFLGDYTEFKTFFHGHSFTANQLGAAASLASLDLLLDPQGIRRRRQLELAFADQLNTLWACAAVGDIRRVGLVAGIELVQNWRTREPFPLEERVGIRICETLARRGVLTRPVGNVIVLMPPYCTSDQQLAKMIQILRHAIRSVL